MRCDNCVCAAPDGEEPCGDCLACKIWSDGCDQCNPQSDPYVDSETFNVDVDFDIGGEG